MSIAILRGDARSLPLRDESVQCAVTSPPYFGLRDYGCPGQLGLEQSPREYVNALTAALSEVRRVLRRDGVLWLNIGDSYYSGRGSPGPNSPDAKQPARRGWVRPLNRPSQDWATPKNLLGIPWRVIFALQDDGWILRSAVVWHKPNAMPEPVTDRLAADYEFVFLLSRSRRYYFDLDAIREPLALDGTRVFGGRLKGTQGGVDATARRRGHNVYGAAVPPGYSRPKNGGPGPHHNSAHPRGRNPGSVWDIATQPYAGAHFACMPVALARRCVLAGSRPGDVVLDPFGGSGTVALVSDVLGRSGVSSDLSMGYAHLARERTADPGERARAMQVPRPPVVPDGQDALFSLEGEAS